MSGVFIIGKEDVALVGAVRGDWYSEAGTLECGLQPAPVSRGLPAWMEASDNLELARRFPDAFAELNEWIVEQAAGSCSLADSIVVIELANPTSRHYRGGDPSSLDPTYLRSGDDWSRVVGALILAFPEVHWVLRVHRPHAAPEWPCGHDPQAGPSLLRRAHVLIVDPNWSLEKRLEQAAARFTEIERLRAMGYRPLLDPAGLRAFIHQQIAGHYLQAEGAQGATPPVRAQCAVVIDDEERFARNVGYIAYRFGFRVHAVRSVRMMRELLLADGQLKHDVPALSLEDVYLNFPDRVAEDSFSNLEQRGEAFPILTAVSHRAAVTTGGGSHDDPNASFFDASTDENGQKRTRVLKPLQGTFQTWRLSGAWTDPHGYAAGFNWPPDTGPHTGGGHSADGMALAVAEQLISRARAIAASSPQPADALRGAVLSLEAQELLLGRTPSAALAALAQQHELEVAAEVAAHGVDYRADLAFRVAEIKRSTTAITGWFDPARRKEADAIARRGILDRMARRFAEGKHFDEELYCLGAARNLYLPTRVSASEVKAKRGIARCAAWIERVVDTIVTPLAAGLMLYFFTILRSRALFTVSVAFFICLFSLWYAACDWHQGTLTSACGNDWYSKAMLTWTCGEALFERLSYSFWIFVGDNAAAPTGAKYPEFIPHLGKLVGFFHLGVVASALYTRLERR